VDALVTDRYLDALLALVEGHRSGPIADLAMDPALRVTIDTLRRSLVRVHPSFRFEERLGRRLAELAAGRGDPAMAPGAGDGVVIPFPGTPGAAVDPLLGAILAGEIDPSDDEVLDRERALDRFGPDRRPFLVGGAALTSAALSIVGVAYVAWRASRPAARSAASGPMARAARAARARRAALAPAGFPGRPA